MYTKQRLLAFLIGAALACSAGAQAPNDRGLYDSAPEASLPAAAGQLDPPARVARLSDMSGNVSFTPAGENDWVQAQLNRPIVTGDRLWTADGGRAELQVGASTVRLDNGSNFDFLNLNDQMAQMELTQGTLNLNIRRLHGDETYEVDTPTIAFVASRVGDYRIDVDPQSGLTTVTAWRGGGDAIGEGGKRVAVAEGQTVRFSDSQLVDYQVNQIRAPDDFDRYASTRDERYERAPARNYVSEDVVGYQDLDQYGSWEDAPEYGHVWYPSSVSADWAPYHDGHWVWVDPWGWTWVDDAPWGFAPFHYGRWAYVGSRWGWVPGPYDVAPVYSPALVAFVGGGGFGLSVSVGGPIGWFALGPGDVYFPSYRCGRDYFNRVNVGNTYINQTVVNNYYGSWSNGSVNYSQLTYANRDAPRAMTAVQPTAFVSGRPVASSAIAVNRTTMASARVMPRAMVAPTQASLVAGRGRAAAPPSAVANRTVVAAHTPPPRTPSFAQRQSVLQKNGGQPLSVNQMHTLAAQTNGRGTNATAANVRVVGERGGGAAAARSMAAAQLRSSNNAAAASNSGNSRGAQQSANGRNLDRSAASSNVPSSRVRSADFAHPGAQNNGPRTSTARAARGEPNNTRSTPNDNRGRQFTETARGNQRGNPPETTAQQSRTRSSSFAHGPSSGGRDTANRGAETRQQQRATAATAPNNTRNAEARNNESVRGNASAARSMNRTAPETGRSMAQQSESASRSRGNTHAPQNSRSTAETTRETSRPSTPAFSRTPTPGSRASEQRAPNYHAEQQRASPQSRTADRVQQQPAPPSARPTYTLREPQQQRSAPQRSAQAYTQQRAPEQRSAPVQRSAPQREAAPPPQATAQRSPQQQERASTPPPQRQKSVARQAPQHAPPENDKKKKDNNNGGGGG